MGWSVDSGSDSDFALKHIPVLDISYSYTASASSRVISFRELICPGAE